MSPEEIDLRRVADLLNPTEGHVSQLTKLIAIQLKDPEWQSYLPSGSKVLHEQLDLEQLNTKDSKRSLTKKLTAFMQQWLSSRPKQREQK